MKLLFHVSSVLLLFTVAECSRYYLLQGHLHSTENGDQLNQKEIRRVVETEVSDLLPNYSPIISKIRENKQRSKFTKHVEVLVTIDSEITDEIFVPRQKVSFSSYIEVERLQELDDLQEPDCFNEGYVGPNGTCMCQDYYDGDRCQVLNCVNGGIPDEYVKVPQCFCPPGYNDFFCENRGCRPPVQDDINPPSKNLIVLMPATTVFQPLRNQLLDNFESMVNKLQSQDSNWIGQFVGGNYYSANKGFDDDKVFMKLIITANLTEFLTRMRTMDGLTIAPYLNDRDQGLIGALDVVLSDTLNGHVSGYPMIFAYSNTVNIMDDSLYGVDQQANFWRAKIFLNVINNSSAPMDTSSDEFHDYYQYSKSTHSPLFFYNIEEIDDMHRTVLPQLYKPQYVDVRSQTDCSSGLVGAFRDYGNAEQAMNVIITTNELTSEVQPHLTAANSNTSLNSSFTGSHINVYFSLPSSWNSFNFKGNANKTCSIYTWVSSDETALWATHEDSHTDVGGVLSNAEAGYHFAITPISINQTITGSKYQSIDSSNAGIITTASYVSYKPQCTLMYEYEKLQHCNPGTFVHQLTMFTSRGILTRVFPGLCARTYIPNQPDPPTSAPVVTSTYSGTNPPTCTREGTTVFADDRNHPFRDFIFAVEWSDSNSRFINEVEYIIPKLLDSIYDVNYQQRFTFIIFNKFYATTLVSQTRRELFEKRVHSIIENELAQIFSGWWNNTETTSDSIDSVILANLETLNPKAQVYVFTADPGTGAQPNLNKILPKSIQVNYFYNSQIFDAYPFSVMTRQTNGRWLSTSAPDLFVMPYITTTTELIYDAVYQNDDGVAITHTFSVESEATMLEVIVNGAIQNFTLTEASGVPLNATSLLLNTMGISVYDFSQRGADVYTLQVFCTYCTIQIRLASPVEVILGFTGYPNDDTRIQTEPSAWLRMDTTQSYNSYVAARVTGLPANETVKSFTVSAHMGSLHGTSFTANTQSNVNQMVTNMQLRNSSYCSYQWIGEINSIYEFLNWTPELDGIQFIVSIKTDKGNEYTRIVYYYQPNELLSDSICQNGGTLDGYGDCLCTVNFTGDYCQVPVCQNGGRHNFGACNCQLQYMGQFCQKKITVQYVPITTTTTSQPITTTMNIPITTTMQPQATKITIQKTTVTAPTTTNRTSTISVTQLHASSSEIPRTTTTTATKTNTGSSKPMNTVPSTILPVSSTRLPEATTQNNGGNSVFTYLLIAIYIIGLY